MDFSDHPSARRAEAFLLVRSEIALLAIPVNSIAPPEQQGQEARLDLALICDLCDDAKIRNNSITLQSAAGPISLGIDAAEELVHVDELIPLPPLTSLQTNGLVRGLLINPRGDPAYAVALDGVQLGELVAKQITEDIEQAEQSPQTPEAGAKHEL